VIGCLGGQADAHIAGPPINQPARSTGGLPAAQSGDVVMECRGGCGAAVEPMVTREAIRE
jgi:hypothetical protein